MSRRLFVAIAVLFLACTGSTLAFDETGNWTIVAVPPPPSWEYNIDPSGVTEVNGMVTFDTSALDSESLFISPHPNFTTMEVSELDEGLFQIELSVDDPETPTNAVSGIAFSIFIDPVGTPGEFEALDLSPGSRKTHPLPNIPELTWFGESEMGSFTRGFGPNNQPFEFQDWSVTIPEPSVAMMMFSGTLGFLAFAFLQSRRKQRLVPVPVRR